jgi:hypothetical protein
MQAAIFFLYSLPASNTHKSQHKEQSSARKEDRICGLHLGVTASQLAKLATITQVPFLVLLQIFSEDDSDLPSGFLVDTHHI